MSFSADLKSFARKSQISLKTARDGVCMKLFGAVVMDTPVLSGTLRGNWICSLNQPASGPPAAPDKSGTRTVAAITQVIAGSTLQDTVVMLQNVMPYSYRVEYEGWSHTKAPEGMLRKNVRRIVSLLNKEASK